ncbi:MAG: protein translocase subunit SecF [Chloroflexi bacterium]|nr:protein translocase subunit SecF [Chloroflexota bacterium]
MIDILGKRYLFFAISALLIVPGLVILAIFGLPLSIDFEGGTMLDLSFASGNVPSTEEVHDIYLEHGLTDPQITSSSNGVLLIRSSFMDEGTRADLINEMEARFDDTVIVNRADSVGPTVGREVATRAAVAVGGAALAVIIYITLAFRGVQHSFRYGVCAIIAMIHDVLVVLSLAGIGGLLFGWQVDSLFLTALLSVIGFSVQDKVVVFDRIRENSAIYRKLPFEKLANHSIVQTLQRSINTQLMTVEYMLLALALFGGVTLRQFSITLLVGLFMGTYSSIFIAAPILVIWEKKEWRNWFGRKAETPA